MQYTLHIKSALTFKVGLSGFDSFGVVKITGGLIDSVIGSNRDLGLYSLPFFVSP